MATLKITRRSTVRDDSNQSYRLTLEASEPNGITKYVFVKQRIRNFQLNTFEDVFAAVATPAQLEDFADETNLGGQQDTTYFRSDKIDIVSRNVAYLDEVFNSIMFEVDKLLKDVAALTLLGPEVHYDLDSAN